MRELTDRFDQSEFLREVLGLESLLLKAADGDNYESELESIQYDCFTPDLNLPSLEKQLILLVDATDGSFPANHLTNVDKRNMAHSEVFLLIIFLKIFKCNLLPPSVT